MKMKLQFVLSVLILFCLSVSTAGCSQSGAEIAVDEAKAAGKTAADFPTHPYDLFKDMDGGIELTQDEFKGRNSWLMWTGGNEAFWDYFARHGGGVLDLLKILDNRHVKRSERLQKLGLINEPGYTEATEADQYGLWLDTRVDPEPEHPPNPAVYGYSSGIVGLRLFPNPNFNDEATRKWDPERFINDENYYKDPALERPYRVGMSCAFCHVSFHPLHPPANPLEPEWANLSSTIGAQYFKPRGVFAYDMKEDNILWQLLNSSLPGTIDTSLIATDGINNPNTMNAIFDVPARIGISLKIKPEKLADVSCAQSELPEVPTTCPDRPVARILINGEDSIGTRAALTRVYVNIGEYHQEWLRDTNLMIGFKEERPFDIKQAQANSVYWQASDYRAENIGKFFLKSTGPMPLEEASWTDEAGVEHSGSEFIDDSLVQRGKIVFAENCFFCHSSKQPEELGFWDNPTDYNKWSNNAAYLERAREIVSAPDFRDDNYLSTDQRYPVTLIGTNASRSLADNATRGRVWSEFSSETFKNLPSVGEIEVLDPYKGTTQKFHMPAGGPGRYRPPPLIGIWATAPFLHNNSVGTYPPGHDPVRGEVVDVSIPGRLAVFNDSIEKLLWPEKRASAESVYRLTIDSYIDFPYPVVADYTQRQVGLDMRLLLWGLPLLIAAIGVGLFIWGYRLKAYQTLKKVGRWFLLVAGPLLVVLALVFLFFSFNIYNNGIRLGPIPKGTPIGLIFNGINSPPYPGQPPDKFKILQAVGWDLGKVGWRKLPSLDHPDVPNLVPNLLKISKSPDFVINRGHMFGTKLSDEDKRALIEFLKTF